MSPARRKTNRGHVPVSALVPVLVLGLILMGCGGETQGEATTAAAGSGPTDTVSTDTVSTDTDSTDTASTGVGSTDATPTAVATTGDGGDGDTTGTGGPGAGCYDGSTEVPPGAVSGPAPDVDGDDRPDTVWIATAPSGETTVGVVTAAGGGAERPFRSASPVTRAVLVTAVNDRSPVVLLADDGRSVQLWAFVDCGIADVVDGDGEPYIFSLGFSDIGTGVGCATVDGHNELVGLHTDDASGDTVEWSATVVTVDGTTAANGTIVTGTYQRPAADAAIAALRSVTCGERTMADDGVAVNG